MDMQELVPDHERDAAQTLFNTSMGSFIYMWESALEASGHLKVTFS